MAKSWRDCARPIIAKVLTETKGQDEKVIKRALFDAYPFGQRAMYPYKIWRSEIKRQRLPFMGKTQKQPPVNDKQLDIFSILDTEGEEVGSAQAK